MKLRPNFSLKSGVPPRLALLPLAGALLALCISSTAQAQDTHEASCVTSVVLRICPDQQPTPFQSEADRKEAARRQQLQDQFATTEKTHQRRAAQADNDLDTVTVYGQQLSPTKPALVEFGQTVAKSGPKDCRNAYCTAGPKGDLGVFDPIYDSVTGKPCSWK